MKKSIIILLTLIVLCVLPVLASTPEQENAPIQSHENTTIASQKGNLFLVVLS